MIHITNLLGIVGRISSGKSYMAKKIAADHTLQIVSFGRYLFDYSQSNNLPVDRTSLQDLGETFVRADAAKFLQNVLAHSEPLGKTIIIEGIRHKAIFELLREKSNSSFFLYIDEELPVRYERYISRVKESDSKVTISEFVEIDNHPVEREIETIRKLCDQEIGSTISDRELHLIIPFIQNDI